MLSLKSFVVGDVEEVARRIVCEIEEVGKKSRAFITSDFQESVLEPAYVQSELEQTVGSRVSLGLKELSRPV